MTKRLRYSNTEKRCPSCGVTKALTDFHKDSHNKRLGVATYCRKCTLEKMKIWYRKNIEKRREYRIKNKEKIKGWGKQWRANNKRDYHQYNCLKYGITSQDYLKILQAQNGGCAICGKPANRRKLDIDHCHLTGRVRGLLCPDCNIGIGRLGDSTEHLKKALIYLEKF